MEIKLGESIRRLRKDAGFTQEQLAEALGVTTGAVYKWESGKAMPELEMLVDIAEFFETSVDALLNYGWKKLSMGQSVEKLRQFCIDKNLTDGMRYAEKALQKYPNSFQIVLRSAELYFLTMTPEHMPRAVELYERAISLADQSDHKEIAIMAIQNRIAHCYAYMDRVEDAVRLLGRNNLNGINNATIGLLLSKKADTAERSLSYLSDALHNCYSDLCNICIGYANAYAYGSPRKLDGVTDLILWLYELGRGLRDPNVVTWMDRGDAKLFIILAEMDMLRGDEAGACSWLRKAKEAADKFDAAPEYHISVGMKFYHGSEDATSYDDMGGTALEMIGRVLADDQAGQNLLPLWEKIRTGE